MTQSTRERIQEEGKQKSNFQSRKDHQEAWRRRRCTQQPCSYTRALRTQLLWYKSRAHESSSWQARQSSPWHWVGGSLSHSLLQFTMASFLCLGPSTLQRAPRSFRRPMYEFFILSSNLLLRLLLSLLIDSSTSFSGLLHVDGRPTSLRRIRQAYSATLRLCTE